MKIEWNKLLKHIQYIAFKVIRFISNSIQFNVTFQIMYTKLFVNAQITLELEKIINILEKK